MTRSSRSSALVTLAVVILLMGGGDEARIEGLASEYARQIRFGNDERERLILIGKEKPCDEEMLMGQNKTFVGMESR